MAGAAFYSQTLLACRAGPRLTSESNVRGAVLLVWKTRPPLPVRVDASIAPAWQLKQVVGVGPLTLDRACAIGTPNSG